MFNGFKSLCYYANLSFEIDWRHVVYGIYVVALFFVTFFKIAMAAAIFRGKPIFEVGTPQATQVGTTMDTIWLILAAILPVFFSFYLQSRTPRLSVTIDWAAFVQKQAIVDAENTLE